MYPSSVKASGFRCDVDEPREILKLPVRVGVLSDFKEDDGAPLACMVGPDAEAPEAYVITRNTGDKKRPRDALVMLGFSGPALARVVFFATHKPAEYSRLATWKAARYLELLEGEPSDEFGDSDAEGSDED